MDEVVYRFIIWISITFNGQCVDSEVMVIKNVDTIVITTVVERDTLISFNVKLMPSAQPDNPAISEVMTKYLASDTINHELLWIDIAHPVKNQPFYFTIRPVKLNSLDRYEIVPGGLLIKSGKCDQ